MKAHPLKILIALLLLHFNSQAQHFDAVLKTLNNEYRQEKIYLHCDRSAYSAGETVWLKGYLSRKAVCMGQTSNILQGQPRLGVVLGIPAPFPTWGRPLFLFEPCGSTLCE